MRKILFVMVAALAFVACEKDDYSGEMTEEDKLTIADGGHIRFFHNSEPLREVFFDKTKGGTITIEAEVDAAVCGIGIQTEKEYIFDEYYEYDIPAPEYIIKLKQIQKHKEFIVDGCKVVPNGLRKFTITVEPNCGYSLYNIYFCRIVETKKYGKVAAHGATVIPIAFQ